MDPISFLIGALWQHSIEKNVHTIIYLFYTKRLVFSILIFIWLSTGLILVKIQLNSWRQLQEWKLEMEGSISRACIWLMSRPGSFIMICRYIVWKSGRRTMLMITPLKTLSRFSLLGKLRNISITWRNRWICKWNIIPITRIKSWSSAATPPTWIRLHIMRSAIIIPWEYLW